jgi:pyruvate dehydrogenase E2 component (dihydrolipoamide acetyltransferase)
MATEFKLPELGEGVESADVSRIYVSEGDEIEANQNIMELETEKAVADLPCPHAGKVSKVHVSEGDTIDVGQTLLSIEELEVDKNEDNQQGDDQSVKEDAAQETQEEPATEEKERPQSEERSEVEEDVQSIDEEESAAAEDVESDQEKDAPEPTAADKRAEGDGKHVPSPAGPATRRLARKLGVDLDDFHPAQGDRIRSEDVVRAYVESDKAAALASEPLPDFSRFGTVEREPQNKIARTAARRLSASWRTIPHVTQHGQADITELETARRQHLEHAGDHAVKITLTSIACKSVAGLLKQFPKFNASLDTNTDELILKKHYHMGVAVDTDQGLLVPVIRDADRKSIEQIAAELQRIANQARRRQLAKEDLEGSTFTISNQGGIGGGEFTPIINYPEVAILGMGRARAELRMIDGQPAERLLLPLSLSYDHRVINGADAARFIDRLEQVLSDEFSLLIAT